ncbi:hypothetical protein LBBP_03823 [Leptospira borgpetersenii serovar Ballum]|uniref:Uncharacterized protein n=1 Tax=Leptospira borgpetersenii serovar Ballum TaxID=280505 RepID=A0A0S2IWE0_LEPBO|nr:hypothetical protein LBBP_03823 [Leptospira borgpetersenii serovar Ballum]
MVEIELIRWFLAFPRLGSSMPGFYFPVRPSKSVSKPRIKLCMQDPKGILYRQEGTNEFPSLPLLLNPIQTEPNRECIQIFCFFKPNFQIIPFYKKSNRFNFNVNSI